MAKTEAKMVPKDTSIEKYLDTLIEKRREEAVKIIGMMEEVSKEKACLWGDSIIGFGKTSFKYDTGREGIMPKIAFSPRKAKLTFYFNAGFNEYARELKELGKYTTSVSCLYANKLADLDFSVLRKMMEITYKSSEKVESKKVTVGEFLNSIPEESKIKFEELRRIVQNTLKEIPEDGKEVISYGVLGYKIDEKRARVYISGYRTHLSLYPLPNKNEKLMEKLKPYIKGKGTLWFSLTEELPVKLIEDTVRELAK